MLQRGGSLHGCRWATRRFGNIQDQSRRQSIVSVREWIESVWWCLMKVVLGGMTQINPNQLRLRQLFSVERILSARGLQVQTEGTATQTILEKDFWTQQDLDQMFQIFESTQMRSDLFRAISESTYIPSYSIVSDLVCKAEFRRDRQRYSTTFEWFVGELLIRKFMAFSSSFGVSVAGIFRNSDGGTSGDYDVLSVLGDMSLLYVECKTGKCHLSSILNTIERSIALHSVACIILLRDGVSKGMLLQQLRGQSHPRFGGISSFATIATRGLPESEIYEWGDCFFLSSNIENRLRTVMRILAAYRSSIFGEIRPHPREYQVMGYDYSEDSL